MEVLSAIENVVRVIFPLTMIRDGELLPAAFKLREQKVGPEEYLSVFRQYAETFLADISAFDKGRNLPCCIINVGEVNAIDLTIKEKRVNYNVRAVPTSVSLSHAGIFIQIDEKPLKGNGIETFESLGIGQEASFYIMAIRRRLVDIAKKRMTNVSMFRS